MPPSSEAYQPVVPFISRIFPLFPSIPRLINAISSVSSCFTRFWRYLSFYSSLFDSSSPSCRTGVLTEIHHNFDASNHQVFRYVLKTSSWTVNPIGSRKVWSLKQASWSPSKWNWHMVLDLVGLTGWFVDGAKHSSRSTHSTVYWLVVTQTLCKSACLHKGKKGGYLIKENCAKYNVLFREFTS